MALTDQPNLPRQFCRGHLERTGEMFTVGTLPSGETRPYRTETTPDGRRFHYCLECDAALGRTSTHRLDRFDLRQRHERGAVAVCTCGQRFARSSGELAHQAVEAHVFDVEVARILHPSGQAA